MRLACCTVSAVYPHAHQERDCRWAPSMVDVNKGVSTDIERLLQLLARLLHTCACASSSAIPVRWSSLCRLLGTWRRMGRRLCRLGHLFSWQGKRRMPPRKQTSYLWRRREGMRQTLDAPHVQRQADVFRLRALEHLTHALDGEDDIARAVRQINASRVARLRERWLGRRAEHGGGRERVREVIPQEERQRKAGAVAVACDEHPRAVDRPVRADLAHER
mmetsp:Transcript_34656/g.101662  ORF Transcript_34656/g.101662 Transcript_34656/m.101662 type:complete len:219 (-) Transcript_34656:223-879(-)